MDHSKAQLITKNGETLPFLGMRLNGQLDGLFFEAEIEQSFTNPTTKHIEVVYTFPLPFGAVLLDVKVRLGDLDLTGSVIGRKKAGVEYEEAISDGNAAIMLERNHDGTHTLNLGNLTPNEHCVVRIRYAQVLSFEQRGIRLLIPTVIAPRYGNPIKEGKLSPHQVPEHDLKVRYPFEFSIEIRGELANSCISSPSHAIGVRHPSSDGRQRVMVSLASDASLDRDLIINLSDLNTESLALLSSDMSNSAQTASLLSFCPSLLKSDQDAIAVKFLVDCSGSMGGDSIKAARRALQAILTQLKPKDRFSLSKFGNTVSHRSRSLWAVKGATTVSAQRWICQLDADMGGTEMESALQSTIEIVGSTRSEIFLITDGEIYGIDSLLETAAKSGHRIFVIGIGTSPSETNLRKLAEVSGGACDFVAPGENVEPAIVRMFGRLRSPRAESLELIWPEGMQPLWETPLPLSAFDGDTLNVYALWPKTPQGTVTLHAKIDGNPDSVALTSINFPQHQSTETALSRFAAYNHLGSLQSEEAESFALTYQLITPHTNFLLIHERAEDEKALEMPELIKIQQMIPAGWGSVGTIDPKDVVFCARPSEVKLSMCMNSVDEIDYTELKRRPSQSKVQVFRKGSPVAKSADYDMDLQYLDIPAFLRRSPEQCDFKQVASPFGRQRLNDGRPITLVEWLIGHDRKEWPTTFRELDELGIIVEVITWIRIQAEDDRWSACSEEEIISAFLEALPQIPPFSSRLKRGLLQGFLATVRGEYRHHPLHLDTEFTRHVAESLKDIQADGWGNAINEVFDCMT